MQHRHIASGHMGKRVSEATKTRAMTLLKSGSSVSQTASRLGLSESVIRNWMRGTSKLANEQKKKKK